MTASSNTRRHSNPVHCFLRILVALTFYSRAEALSMQVLEILHKIRESHLLPGRGIAATPYRRHFVSFIVTALVAPSSCSSAVDGPTLRLRSPGDRLGLELFETEVGADPSRRVLAVRRVVVAQSDVRTGMVLRNYNSREQLSDALKNGPYPIDLTFYDLAAGGDAIGDLGRPIVSATTALDAARAPAVGGGGDGFVLRTVRPADPTSCAVQSRRGDLLEIRYEGRVGSMDGPVYDSSAGRGTGQPYLMVLGSGDMVPGVDLGMYDMCKGEVRTLEIPPSLAYGDRGSRVYRIPGKSRLFWTVELILLNRDS